MIKILLMISIFGISVEANAEYTVTDLGLNYQSYGGGYVAVDPYSLSMNNFGQIAGILSGNAAALNNGAWSNLGLLDGVTTHANGFGSSANGLNNLGQVVGWSYADNSYTQHATLCNGSTPSDLGALTSFTGIAGTGPNGNSSAYGINDTGQIVGVTGSLPYVYSQGQIYGPRATLWNNGTVTDLGTLNNNYGWSFAYSINNAGQAVGWSHSVDSRVQATLWDNGTISALGPAVAYGEAYSINSSGQAVGVSSPDNITNPQATMWINGTLTVLPGIDGGTVSTAHSINDMGQIVGASSFANNIGYGAALWANGKVYNLNSLLTAKDAAAGWVIGDAKAINNNGQILALAYNALGASAVLLNPVPELNTNIMLLMGLGLFGFMARLQKKQYQLTSQSITTF